jgi:hypothetical protein
MCGGEWHPGAALDPEPPLEPFTAEWVCYVINEGSALFAESDDADENCPVQRFSVVEATRDELGQLKLLASPPPEGARILLADGREFWSRFGRIVGGNDECYTSMADLDADFTMTVPLTPHMLTQERMITLQGIVAKLAESTRSVSIEDGMLYFRDGESLSLTAALEMPPELRAMVGGPVAVTAAYLPPKPGKQEALGVFFDRLTRAMVHDRAVITIGDHQYRHARKGEAFEDGDFEHTPAATGIFVRNPVTSHGKPDTFRWMYLCSSDDLDLVLRPLIANMTDIQREAVLVNLSFGAVMSRMPRPPRG